MRLPISHASENAERSDVFVIPKQRVLELLVPMPLYGIARNPAFSLVHFNHEHAIRGNDDLLNQRSAVSRGQGDVLNEEVTGFIEKQSGRKVNQRFPSLAFEPGRFDDRRNEEERNQIPDGRWNGVLKGVQYLGVVHPSSLTAALIRFL